MYHLPIKGEICNSNSRVLTFRYCECTQLKNYGALKTSGNSPKTSSVNSSPPTSPSRSRQSAFRPCSTVPSSSLSRATTRYTSERWIENAGRARECTYSARASSTRASSTTTRRAAQAWRYTRMGTSISATSSITRSTAEAPSTGLASPPETPNPTNSWNTTRESGGEDCPTAAASTRK